jgi:hypothetical protein
MKKVLIMMICVGGLVLESCNNRRNYSGGHDAGRETPGTMQGDGSGDPDLAPAGAGVGTRTPGTGTTTDTIQSGTGTAPAPGTGPGTTR